MKRPSVTNDTGCVNDDEVRHELKPDLFNGECLGTGIRVDRFGLCLGLRIAVIPYLSIACVHEFASHCRTEEHPPSNGEETQSNARLGQIRVSILEADR